MEENNIYPSLELNCFVKETFEKAEAQIGTTATWQTCKTVSCL